MYNGFILHAHPVRGESHNQRNTTGEVATVSFGFSKKKLLGTLPPLLNTPMGFITKFLEKTVQR